MLGMQLAGRDAPGSSQKREGRTCVQTLFPLRRVLLWVLLGVLQGERAWQALNTEKPGFESRLCLSELGQVRQGIWSCHQQQEKAISSQWEARKGGKTLSLASTVHHPFSSPLCRAPPRRAGCCVSLTRGTVWD